MQFTKKTILIGTAAAIGVAAIGGTAVAATGVVDRDDAGDAREAAFERELAQKLGVPEADVERALEEIHGERLADRVEDLVEDGRLSPEQAAEITRQAQAGDSGAAMTALHAALLGEALEDLVEDGRMTQAQADEAAKLAGEGVPLGVRGHDRDHDDDDEHRVADAFHQQEHLEHLQQRGAITAEQAREIEALIAAGKADEAEQRLHALRDAGHLERLVRDGAITQAQADRVQALIDAGAPIGIGGPKGHHGKGGHHDEGDHHGKGDHGDGWGGDAPQPGMAEPPAGDGGA